MAPVISLDSLLDGDVESRMATLNANMEMQPITNAFSEQLQMQPITEGKKCGSS